MQLFAVDADNTITAFPAAEQIPEGQLQFASEKELAKLAADWPADRLVEIWNSFAGVAGFGVDLKPVKKFKDRKTAVTRIWNAIQKLDGAGTETAEAATTESAKPEAAAAPKAARGARKAAKVAPKKAKATKGAKAKDGAPTLREGSKKQIVIDMLRRKNGATLAEIAKATDWQKHTIRGFMSILGSKSGLPVESFKTDAGDRGYKLAK
jgi:Protein of unknown function (DUF3489)